MDIKEIISLDNKDKDIIAALKEKSIQLTTWSELEEQYNPKKHPVMNKSIYPDRVEKDGSYTKVSRVTYDLQRLAVKRLTALCFGVPVKRVYEIPEGREDLQKVADLMEGIFKDVRIDSLNMERGRSLFASCEVMTVWYASEESHKEYGIDAKMKLRVMTYSPMKGDSLYPLFDEHGDLIALSVEYKRKRGNAVVTYFDCYTAEYIVHWVGSGKKWTRTDEVNAIGKIPAVYMYRETPAWEDESTTVEEMEWTMSRNGNYLRENSRPLFVVFADEEIAFGEEPSANAADKSILKYPKGSNANYVTWQQAVDSLKFHMTELRQKFWSQLQIPDWSFENMKASALSGEAMKYMYIDSTQKVTEESGRLIEGCDREVNVVKAFMKKIEPSWADLIDELRVHSVITPCTIESAEDDNEERSGENDGSKNVK